MAVTAAGIDRKMNEHLDPRMVKALSEIEAQKAQDNEYGAMAQGITSKAVLGNFQDALKILCATLKNQDPTNPMDTKDISQQFSIVAQTQASVEMKEILQQMANSNEVSKMLEAAKQLDSLVKIKGDTFNYSPHEQVELGFYAPPETVKASYIITDARDQVVRIIDGDVGKSADGYHGLVWDGKDRDGQDVTPGKYKFRVSLVGADGEILRDQAGQPQIAKTTIFGRIHGSDLKAGKPRFSIAGNHYSMDGLISIQSAAYHQEKMGLAWEALKQAKDSQEGGSLEAALKASKELKDAENSGALGGFMQESPVEGGNPLL